MFSFNNGNFDTISHFTNLSKGSYIITVQDGNKCNVSSDAVVASVTQDCNTSIVFAPNPTSTEFKITIGSQISDNIQIEVYNSLGKLVYAKKANKHSSFGFGAAWTKGAYLVYIKAGDQNLKYKLLKN